MLTLVLLVLLVHLRSSLSAAAMKPHPALTNYDILFEIVQQFSLVRRPYDVSITRSAAYWGPPHPVIDDNQFNWERSYTHPMEQERRMLASLSLTCRALSELALDELWAAPCGGLYTLLRLFPAFTHREANSTAWKFERRTYHPHQYVGVMIMQYPSVC